MLILCMNYSVEYLFTASKYLVLGKHMSWCIGGKPLLKTSHTWVKEQY